MMKREIHDSSDLGLVLRSGRKVYGLTQQQASKLCGVSSRLWSECENGKRPQVGFETALRMLQIVGVDISAERRRGVAQISGPANG